MKTVFKFFPLFLMLASSAASAYCADYINASNVAQEADDEVVPSSENDSIKIYDVKYDYELEYSGGYPETKGPVIFKTTVPENTYGIVIRSTVSHYDYRNDSRYPIWYSLYNGDCIVEAGIDPEFIINYKSWGSYIIAIAYDESGSKLCTSEPINTLDYIDDEDRAIILSYYAGVTEVETEEDFHIYRDRIEVKSETSGLIQLYGLNGVCVFSSEFSGSQTISLPNNLPRNLIMRVLLNDGKSVTKKVLR